MNPYIVIVSSNHEDVEMPNHENVEMPNHEDEEMPDADSDETDDENTRDRILNWVFTARSVALQNPPFMMIFHLLREAFDRNEQRQMEFQLHRLLPLVFELDDDPVNISRAEWANLSLQLQGVENLDVEGLPNGFDATFRSADRSHAVRVQLPQYRENINGFMQLVAAPAGPAIIIKYMGFLSFRGHSSCGDVVRSFMFPPRL